MTRPAWTLGNVFVLRHAGFPFDWLEQLGLTTDAVAALDRVLDGDDPDARAQFAATFDREMVRLRAGLLERARDRRVQEAVFLSSPAMYENVWARWVAATEHKTNSDGRRTERHVYSYLKRLCGKNETTSFFGPMGYGETASGTDFRVESKPETCRRRVFISLSAVRELALAIARERTLRCHLPTRANPLFVFESRRVHCGALDVDVALDDDTAALVSAIRETRTVAAAAAALSIDLEVAERRLRPLFQVAAIVRAVPLETHGLAVLDSLRAAVTALPALPAREQWILRLDELDRLRAAFEVGELDARRTLLTELEARFSEWTGKPARRGEGQMYADRLVVYEEASSQFAIRVTPAFLERLAARVAPALELSAAFGESIQRGYRADVTARLRQLSTPIDFAMYSARVRPDEEPQGSRFAPVRRVMITATDQPELDVQSDLCGTAASGGRYALPDVCIAAHSPGAVVDGRFEVIVARVHHHLLLWSWLATFFEERSRFEHSARDWIEHEPTARGLVALGVRRRNKGFYCFPGPELGHSVTDAFEARALVATDLEVDVVDDQPVLRDREGVTRLLYLPLDDFTKYAPFAALAHPMVLHAPLRTGTDQVPRVRIGGAIYQRRQWHVDLSALLPLTGVELMIAARRLMRHHGWPRFVFCRVASERKPYLIDLLSPFALEVMRHMLRSGGMVTVEEMLPAPEDLWLRDEQGRYTCELRMQATRWTNEP